MADVYVSPSGNDVTGDGTAAKPWATIAKAATQVQTLGLIGPGMRADCNVNLATGGHRVTAKLTHGPALSGQNGFKLRYVGAGRPGQARVLGTQRVTGWTLDSGSVYKATIGTTPIHTLYEDGWRARKARFPKYSFQSGFPLSQSPYVRAQAGAAPIVQYAIGDMDPTTWGTLSQLEMVIMSGGSFAWFADVVPVQSVNTGARQFTLTRAPRYDVMAGGSGSRFFCQNTRALLTQAGEFFHDTAAGILYYQPRKPGDPNLFAIEYPVVKTVFEFVGTDVNNRTHDIELYNLAVSGSDFTNDYMFAWKNEGDSGEGHVYGSYDRLVTRPVHRQGLVTLTDCDGISIRNVELDDAGYNGIYGYGWNKGHTIENVWIHRCGVNGLYIDGRYPGEGDFSRDNLIRNVRANDCGQLVQHGGGIILTNSGHSTVQNIEALNCCGEGYAFRAYSFGGGGYPAPPANTLYCEGITASRVLVRAACQDRGDVGGIGTFGLGSRLTGDIKANTVDGFDVSGVAASPDMYDVQGDGVFTDEESRGQNYRNGKIASVAGQPTRENGPDSTGTQSYTNVQGKTTFDANLVPVCGVDKAYPW